MSFVQKTLLKLYFRTPVQNKILNIYKELNINHRKSLRDNQAIQLKKLNLLLNHAYNFIPFYKKHWNGVAHIKNNKICLKSVNQLYDFPILTKELIKSNTKELISLDVKQRKSFINTSGGSTGEPLTLIQDEKYQVNNLASFYLSRTWKGIGIYDKTIHLWGAERDTFKGKKPFIEKVKDFILNTNRLNTFILNSKKIKKYIDIINKSDAKLIIGYVQSIHEIALFAKENNLYINKQNAIHCAAGTLYDFMRKDIEDVFKCSVYNHYGSREVGAIASECVSHDGLHILMDHNIVQPMNFNHSEKETNIIITNLNNFSMPLVRYDIGDVGVFYKNQKKCECGITYPKIKKVVGRTTDFFLNKFGDKIDGEYFTHLLYFIPKLNKFQIVQEDLHNIQIIIQGPSNSLSNESKYDIIEKIKLVMGYDCNIKFLFVNEIKKTKTGKFIYTKSKLNN